MQLIGLPESKLSEEYIGLQLLTVQASDSLSALYGRKLSINANTHMPQERPQDFNCT